VTDAGAIPVRYGAELLSQVRATATRIDAVLDAAGRKALPQALELTGGPERVISLSDPHAAQWGVRLSAPTPERAPNALQIAMPLLASKALTLKPQITAPMAHAGDIHRQLENGQIRTKVVLVP
jgi:hypothetical protein